MDQSPHVAFTSLSLRAGGSQVVWLKKVAFASVHINYKTGKKNHKSVKRALILHMISGKIYLVLFSFIKKNLLPFPH